MSPTIASAAQIQADKTLMTSAVAEGRWDRVKGLARDPLILVSVSALLLGFALLSRHDRARTDARGRGLVTLRLQSRHTACLTYGTVRA